jgi:acetyl-CoA C-acetyltransferase
MVERLRETPDALGLVSALGWYFTKHAVGIYGAQSPDRPWVRGATTERQRAIDALPGPEFVREVAGRGAVETYTVLHDRDGAATEAIVIVRCAADGVRLRSRSLPATCSRRSSVKKWVGAQVLYARRDSRNEFRLAGGEQAIRRQC